jgi:hypothetical protein
MPPATEANAAPLPRCTRGLAWSRLAASCCMDPQAAARPRWQTPLLTSAASHFCEYLRLK